jgi:hypothetical protein
MEPKKTTYEPGYFPQTYAEHLLLKELDGDLAVFKKIKQLFPSGIVSFDEYRQAIENTEKYYDELDCDDCNEKQDEINALKDDCEKCHDIFCELYKELHLTAEQMEIWNFAIIASFHSDRLYSRNYTFTPKDIAEKKSEEANNG